jgi:hypothetical protein
MAFGRSTYASFAVANAYNLRKDYRRQRTNTELDGRSVQQLRKTSPAIPLLKRQLRTVKDFQQSSYHWIQLFVRKFSVHQQTKMMKAAFVFLPNPLQDFLRKHPRRF